MLYIKKKNLLIIFLFIISFIGSFIFKLITSQISVNTNTVPIAYVALVIDDLGGDEEGVEELLKLDIPVTVAVLPFLENSKIHTEKSLEAGFEVIIHLSMEPEQGQVSWMGPRSIKYNTSKEEIKSIMYDSIKEIKGAKGINNHMGSKVMKDKGIMTEVIRIIKEHNLYFLDSRTGEYSVAEEIATDLHVTYFYRDLFLDNSKSEEKIRQSIEELVSIAFDKGYAIGIGHIGAQGGINTINTIDHISKELRKRGVVFVYLSELDDIIKSSK